MLEVKQASSMHLTELIDLFDAYRCFYQMPTEKKQVQLFLQERLKRKDSLILMAFIQQQAVGLVQVYPVFSSVAMRPVWLLNDLFVAASHRQQGVAKELLTQLENQAKAAQVFSIKLTTAVDNHAAKNLYDSLGYGIIQNFDHYSKRL